MPRTPRPRATASESPAADGFGASVSGFGGRHAKLQHRTAIKEEQQQRNLQLLSATRTTTATAARQWKTGRQQNSLDLPAQRQYQPLAAFRAAEVDARKAVTATKAAAAAA
uniref:Uncharacterized protein n=1 Tax=Macrostomum lignano TaxID=282301 RepID=A0A1I8F4I1_9PLAT